MTFKVEMVSACSEALLEGVARLLPQLSQTAVLPHPEAVSEIVASPSTRLFVGIDGCTMAAMLTLVLVRIPTGLRGHIEDVVVDRDFRNKGYGKALAEAAIAYARSQGLRNLDLTSRPSRIAAIRLYEGLGFSRRETNVFRLDL